MKDNETRRTTFATAMPLSEGIIKTAADIGFKSASTIEERKEAAKQYREALRKGREEAHRLKLGATSGANVVGNAK